MCALQYYKITTKKDPIKYTNYTDLTDAHNSWILAIAVIEKGLVLQFHLVSKKVACLNTLGNKSKS